MNNRAALLKWSAALKAGAAPAAVRAGQAVLAAELRRRIPDRKGQLRRLAGAGPRVLETAVHAGSAGAHATTYVGARFRLVVEQVLAAHGPEAVRAMTERLGKGSA